MSASKELVDAYSSWEQWTRREGLAIQQSNWLRVSQCQKCKGELQERILRLTEAANAAGAQTALELADCERGLGQIITRLILLETRNAELLADRRQAAESQQAETNNSFRNLRRVQKSYVQPSLAMWHSYS